MICFRDKTWCKFYKECAKPCDRALTPEIIGKAREWWGGDGAPICMYTEKPGCFKESE